MTAEPDIKKTVEDVLNARITSISPLSSARHAEIFRVLLEDGQEYVVKTSTRGKGLDEEARMLKILKDRAALPTPEILHASPHLVIMEHVTSDWQMNDAAQVDTAIHLARLHKVKGESYGFEFDTHIANIKQSNAQNKGWADFFVTNRMLHMAELAYRQNHINHDLMKKIDLLASKAPGIIGAANPPVLIHGDCWGGNILPLRGKIRAFIDPAIYYADHEMELAFLTLFNTADQHFFARYSQEIEIKPGFFEERQALYHIYPLLVHAVLFGRSYARRVRLITDKFL